MIGFVTHSYIRGKAVHDTETLARQPRPCSLGAAMRWNSRGVFIGAFMSNQSSLWTRTLCAFAIALSLPPAALAADEFAVSAAQMQALGVQLQRLDKPASIPGMAYPARVVLPPSQEYVVSAPLAGVVDQLLIGQNEAVKPGQPLLRLSSPELGEQQLKLMEAASRNRLAQRNLQREKQLAAEGIVPERRAQDAETSATEERARLRQAEAALKLAGMDAGAISRVAAGGAMQDALVIRARAGGIVTDLGVKPGQRVQQSDPLARVSDTRKLWLDIQLPVERQSSVTARGGQIAVVGRDAVAVTTSLGTTVSDSQTIVLRAEVTRGAASLRPGEFVQAQVAFAVGGEGWPVPVAAVVRQGDKAYVFVRTDKGFVATPVAVLDSAGQALRVKGALRTGQEIAVTSVIGLKAAWLGKGGGN
ncbi:efflux RND transporter periplasmic adaptor subunit [Pseudomonas aeruginosa]|uniref:efflux RND transporter periplasmic adaptor subunit n=2 Tax=Pseudomonas aeruginosa TaxID=287 RepID=UPI0028145EEB|nr:efflux RND transporter periplasmic adaptor subunit [Pseudomonas aeruginosa]MCM8677547.1 efflux RND transporter periplasmic adaptor subunit [Pseudomonas aeruginosa]MCP2657494.1 efflux RND transporter periplasmic adaptor subunit [Pseudomonas aeruginosa]HDU9069070.1 efflux RND transporter periplasmic adaptor subunit [Pseudomonas aeruginosa]